jgi:DedD protein
VADSDNLEFKKRSRRRLVGAAALALLAAIILPMIMDSEPQLPVRDIQVSIPDRDADSRQARPIAGRPVADAGIAPPPQEQPPATSGGEVQAEAPVRPGRHGRTVRDSAAPVSPPQAPPPPRQHRQAPARAPVSPPVTSRRGGRTSQGDSRRPCGRRWRAQGLRCPGRRFWRRRKGRVVQRGSQGPRLCGIYGGSRDGDACSGGPLRDA